jgi:hypothetical protein
MGIFSPIQEPSRNEAITVNTTSTTISDARNEANPRKVILLRNNSNDSSKIITVFFGATPAVANAGIVLRQYESVTDSSEAGYQCWQGTVNAICAVVGGSLAIMER